MYKVDYSNRNQINAIDMFAVFTGLVQIASYIEILQDNKNSDLMEELHRQDNQFLSKIIAQNEVIIKQNEEILKALNRKGGESDEKD